MQALGTGHSAPPVSTQCVGKGANSDLFLCLRGSAFAFGPSPPPNTAAAVGRQALPPPSAPACQPARVSVRRLLCLAAVTASLSPISVPPHSLLPTTRRTGRFWTSSFAQSPSSPHARRARHARHGCLAPHVLYCAHIAISVGVTEAGGKAGAP